ncbi:tldc domain-containing protein [Stylonychia lemnae]|uniref:Tldc domain-containing protein n=1 Tax=Stylonychia lemnae TaxID=5949 RepID=A0A078A931_STYLE|nr:tldc domain-containing protein [Stylonychia lemnae]|eukprot:CDW77313.1 tldc domain-containing protein [Stylonychia lemnae]
MQSIFTYICKGCNLLYKQSTRIPMMLSCGHIVCNRCIQNQLQNGKTQLTCHLGDSCQQQEGFKLIPVQELIDNLDKIDLVNIYCDTHHDRFIDKYCKTKNQMFCNICSTDCYYVNHEKLEHENILGKHLENYIQDKIPTLKN